MKEKNRKIIGISLFIVLSILVIFVEKKFIPYENGKERLIYALIGVVFICMHFFINIKKTYDVFYKKRYLIGIVIFSLLVLLKFNGSSIYLWNNYIQPAYPIKSSVVMGITRPIRSDEWLVSTMLNLSQATSSVSFGRINSLLSAKDNLVTLFPNLPSFDISLLSCPNYIGYLFLDTERAFSFSWYLPYFVLFFSTFELFMILTKRKKLLSLTGAIMITFSPVTQWWQNSNMTGYGALAVVLFYYFVNSSSKKKKLLLSILFGYTGFLYIMCMYPAWQVPYGYVYFILLIHIIVNNKEKIKKRDFLYLIPIFLVIAIPIYILFKENYDVLTIVNSTVYPGARMSRGGGEWRTLFTYVLDIFYPYKRGFANPCEFSQYLSLFPIPIIYSIYLMIKNRKKDLFLIMADIVLIILSVWVIFPLPGIFSQITLLFMSTENRVQVAIGYLSVIEIIYIMSYYEIKKDEKSIINIKNAIIGIISIIGIVITIKISNSVIKDFYPSFIDLKTSIISMILFTFVIVLFIYNHKRTNYILAIYLIIISIICGALVSPVNKGLLILYDKPFAKEIRKLVKKDKDSIFLAADSGFILANYIAVNGGKVINSTNQVPNLDLYFKLDPELRYDHVYNRYHHLIVDLVEENTNFYLNQDDLITLNLSKKDLCITKTDYLVTNNQNVNKFKDYKMIYDEYGLKIYETGCKEE